MASWRILCYLATAAALAAQQRPSPADPPPAPSQHPGTIEGTIVDSVTGSPIRKAVTTINTLNARQNVSYAAVTDNTGHFQFLNVDPGSYTFNPSAQGYQPNWKTAKPIALTDDQHVTGIKLQMIPLGVVTGKVIDDEGEPLGGVEMAAFHYDYSNGSKSLVRSGQASTDDLGNYRVYDLPPGHYVIRAQLREDRPALPPNTQFNVPETGFAPTFYPGVGDESQASLVEVRPGAETQGTDFRLRRVPVYHVRGKMGMSRVPYQLRTCGSSSQTAYATGNSGAAPGGSFDAAGVPTGTYCLTVNYNANGRTIYAEQPVTVDNRNVDDVIVPPKVFDDIAGQVQIDGTVKDNSRIIVRLGNPLRTIWSSAPVQPGDGGFSFKGVFPGAYPVSISSDPKGLYLKSVEYAQRDAPDGIVNIGADRGPLILHAGTDAGQLTGTARTSNGDPASPVIVEPAGPLASRFDLVRTAATDANGNFQIDGLAPGDYKVFVWEDSDPDLMIAPAFRQEFESDAVPITIQPSGSMSVNVTAISAEKSERVRSKFR